MFSMVTYCISQQSVFTLPLSHLCEWHGHKFALYCHYLLGRSGHTSREAPVVLWASELRQGIRSHLTTKYYIRKHGCMCTVYMLTFTQNYVHTNSATQTKLHNGRYTQTWPCSAMLTKTQGLLTGCTIRKWN